mgnify:CR=1 FL=1
MIDNRFLFISFLIFVILGLFLGSAKARGDDLSNLNAIVDEVAKPYDLAKTIKTLIYIESRNGLYPINLNDPSCGVTHININTYMKRHKIKNTPFNRNKACADLLASPKWAILNAIEELEFWKKIHCGRKKCSKMQFSFVIKSYNAGWQYQSAKANEYYDKWRDAYNELFKGK